MSPPSRSAAVAIDARADVYALGGVLYFMVTGHVPFERDEEAKVWAHLAEPPRARRGCAPSCRWRSTPSSSVRWPRIPTRASRRRATSDGPREAACAGRMPAEPERMVARGAASPAGAPREAGLAEEVPTLTRPPPVSAGGGGRRRRALALGLVAAVAAAAATVAAIAIRGEGIPRPRPTSGRRPAAAPSPAPVAAAAASVQRPGLRVGRVVRNVVTRPNGIAYGGGDLWVVGREEARIARIRAATGRERRRHPYVGRGTLDIAAGPSGVYVAVSALGRIMRFHPRSGRLLGRIQTPLHPVGLALGERDFWAVGRMGGGRPDSLFHYTADGQLLQSLQAPAAVTGIALGGGALWVVTRHPHRVSRLDLRTGRLEPWARLDTAGFGVIYHAGSVWVTMRGADAVARVDVRSRAVVLSATGRAPAGLVIAGGPGARRVHLRPHDRQHRSPAGPTGRPAAAGALQPLCDGRRRPPRLGDQLRRGRDHPARRALIRARRAARGRSRARAARAPRASGSAACRRGRRPRTGARACP